MNNYSHIFKKLKIPTEINDKPNINIYGRFNRKLFDLNQQSLSVDNLKANLADKKHIWEMPFYDDTYFEDNDTSDEESSEEEEDEYSKRVKIIDKDGNEKTKIKLRAYHGLEYFIKKEKEYLAQIAEKRKKDRKKDENLDEMIKLSLQECDFPEDKISKMLETKSYDTTDEKEDAKLALDQSMLDAVEYIPIEEDCEVKRREEGFIQTGDDEDEPDEDFEWMEDLKKRDPNSLQNETFFIFANEMRKPMKAGTQAWNCYGNRSNIFLLVNYGFCFQDNLYDSYKFMVKLDSNFKDMNFDNLIQKNVVYRKDNKQALQEIRLKRNQLNEIFMSVLRSILKATFCYNHPNVNPKTIMLTKIVNLDLEKICLEKYYNTVKNNLAKLENFSTLEADQELLDERVDDLKLSANQKFALIYRSEQKKILRSSLEIVSFLRKCLEKSEGLKSLIE